MPRVSKKTDALVADVLERLSKGEPLAQICRDDDKPHPSAWRDWCDADESLAIAYARAREDGFDAIAAEALGIIDAQPERVMTVTGEDRSESRIDAASVQWAYRRFEARMKLLAKWDPKRYGELVKLAGADGESDVGMAWFNGRGA
jgi:hypothetical protein